MYLEKCSYHPHLCIGISQQFSLSPLSHVSLFLNRWSRTVMKVSLKWRTLSHLWPSMPKLTLSARWAWHLLGNPICTACHLNNNQNVCLILCLQDSSIDQSVPQTGTRGTCDWTERLFSERQGRREKCLYAPFQWLSPGLFAERVRLAFFNIYTSIVILSLWEVKSGF